MKARTKEEKLLIALYEDALSAGSIEAEVDRYEAGKRIGLHPKGIDVICRDLAQTNFIRKRGAVLVVVTDHGLKLIETLLSE